MVCYAFASRGLRQEVLRSGWYLAKVGEELRGLKVSEDSVPRDYQTGSSGRSPTVSACQFSKRVRWTKPGGETITSANG